MFLSCTLFAASGASARAAESAWVQTMGSQFRLIAQKSFDGKTVDAGLQIQLEPGWKTYWRSPGSSGLPPQISLTGSVNVAAFSVAYPVPSAYDDKSGRSAGYKGSVTFPITIEPLFPGQETKLTVSGMLGICKEICVPVPFAIDLDLGKEVASSANVARALLSAKSQLPSETDGTSGIVKARLSPDGTTLTGEAAWRDALNGAAEKPVLFVASPHGVTIDPLRNGRREGKRMVFEKRFHKPLKAKHRDGKWVFVLKTGETAVKSTLPIQ
ncbi:MAG: protein-disulfide reductase DsbD domain-containing protein [Pseudomonadota bacterium]